MVSGAVLCAKDLYKAKYQLLINKRKSTSLSYSKYSKAFIENSNDVHKKIEENNPSKERRILIVFDDIIVDMLSNKNISDNNWNIDTAKFYCPKKYKTKFWKLFIMKIPNKQ